MRNWCYLEPFELPLNASSAPGCKKEGELCSAQTFIISYGVLTSLFEY